MYRRKNSQRDHNHDYSGSCTYLVTINCIKGFDFFGGFMGSKLILNRYGEIAAEEWNRIPEIRSYVTLYDFVIMPNHMHGIIQIEGSKDKIETPRRFKSPKYGLSAVIRGYKSRVTSRIHGLANKDDMTLQLQEGCSAWQRNFHERVIESDGHFIAARNYVKNNPENYFKK